MSHRSKPPSYRLHKPSGKAVVTLPDGNGGRKDVYLGLYGSPESRHEYERIVIEWESLSRSLAPLPQAKTPDLTVNELLLAYFKQHVETYYLKDGRPTSEQHCIRAAARFLKEMHGHRRAAEVDSLALEAVRDAMILPRARIVMKTDPATGNPVAVKKIGRGLSRQTINKNLSRLKAVFKWGVRRKLVPASVYSELACVAGLSVGRSAARETEPVPAVPDHVVEATIPHLSPVVADMIRVQRLTGCRPGEVVQLRACDLDRSGPVWEFRPPRHKNQHRRRPRVIYIGPKAQAILLSYFSLDMTSPLFRPDESERLRNEKRRAGRKLKLWPSHTPEARKKRREGQREERGDAPANLPGDRYTGQSYAQAIAWACKKHDLPHWAPNQLRHTAATEARKRYGLDGSQAVLGHANANVTEIYAELDADKARRVMAEIG